MLIVYIYQSNDSPNHHIEYYQLLIDKAHQDDDTSLANVDVEEKLIQDLQVNSESFLAKDLSGN